MKSSRNPTNQDVAHWLKLWDDYLTALYHQTNDPQRPSELTGGISCYFRPADLPYAR
jgi:hypothetical protein